MVGITADENIGRNVANSVSGLWDKFFNGSNWQVDSQPAYSYEKLLHLHAKFLSQFGKQDLAKENADEIVETLRQLTEALLWGEKQQGNYFRFFCDRSTLSELVRVLGAPDVATSIKVQILQSLSMLVQNIRGQGSVQHLFESSNLNEMILLPLDFTDDEIRAYYITFLKSLAMRLDKDTAHYFLISTSKEAPSVSSFPLYIEATKFFSNSDQMVRATVRTITLQVYRVAHHNEAMRAFVLQHAKETYFGQLAHLLRDLWLQFGDSVEASRKHLPDPSALARMQTSNELQQDLLIYLSDIFELEVPGLQDILSDTLLRLVLVPLLIVGALFPTAVVVRQHRLSLEVALFLLRQVFETFHSPELLQPMASLLLQDKVPAGVTRLLPRELQSVKVAEFIQKNACRGLFLEQLDSPDEQMFLLATAILHACLRNRRALPLVFLQSTNILPRELPKPKVQTGGGIFQLFLNPLMACHTLDLPGEQGEVVSKPEEFVPIMLGAIRNHVEMEPDATAALCSILYDILSDNSVSQHQRCRDAIVKNLHAVFQIAVCHVAKHLESCAIDIDMLDAFSELWGSQNKPRSDASAACSYPCFLLHSARQQESVSQRSSNACFVYSAKLRMCFFFELRRLLIDLNLFDASHFSFVDGMHAHLIHLHKSPLETDDGRADQFLEEDCFELGNIDRIMCSIRTNEGKSMRYFLLNDFWLVVAQPDLAAPGSAIVKVRWPLWRTQSIVSVDDSRVLQLVLKGYKSQGHAGRDGQNSRGSVRGAGDCLKIDLEFDSIERRTAAANHCDRFRKDARIVLQQKVLQFVSGYFNDRCISEGEACVVESAWM
jgi:hypothetical protein